jgi:hypothetical protein
MEKPENDKPLKQLSLSDVKRPQGGLRVQTHIKAGPNRREH